ncbi:MAG: serine protease Do [Methylobacteriaceae bacterium]|jgi:serine protease Do|nr:serine protease Do [Methylobacteriaceae bacterium]
MLATGKAHKLLLACLFPAVLFGTAPLTDVYGMDLTDLSEKIKGQIVQVLTPIPTGGVGLGSGFWVDEGGVVATCWHVVQANPTAKIQIRSAVDALFDTARNNNVFANWEVFSASVVAHDEANDLAILKVDGTPFGQKRAPMIVIDDKALSAHYASSIINDELPVSGQQVLIAGYPLGQPYRVVQEGSVASVAHSLPGWGQTLKILVSTVANHGNSGGPVYDTQGKVVGLLEGELRVGNQERTGLEIVVPSFLLKKLLNSVPK